MVDSVGSSLPPSVQAVNKARSNAQSQRSERVQAASDEVSISAEAQELNEVNRLASESRNLLEADQDKTLGLSETLNAFL